MSDASGQVAQVLRKVKPAMHDELVLQALEQDAPPSSNVRNRPKK